MQARIDSRFKLERLFVIKSVPLENILSTGTLDPAIKNYKKVKKKNFKKITFT